MKNTPFVYKRRATVVVRIGDVPIGGDEPVAVQSMATVDTNRIAEAARQARRIADAGAKIVRFTAQGTREAEALAGIRKALRRSGCGIPLVADIHFNTNAAFAAARNVEKIRINPGNFVDKRAKFERIDYTDGEYAQELARLRETFVKLLDACREHGTALRIGVNHGSLSDRIMSRYGDTPEGMVESAMEFLRICRDEGFGQTVVSMKSSNPTVMVRAYRLLCEAMEREGMAYPLHLGVTEAGEGSDGRVRSAVGIGALLADGIGDTIRVSLTEEPEAEIRPAQILVDYLCGREADCSRYEELLPYYKGDTSRTPFIVLDAEAGGTTDPACGDLRHVPGDGRFVEVTLESAEESLASSEGKILVLKARSVQEHRALYAFVRSKGITAPAVLFREYDEDDPETFQIKAGADFGALLIDGIGDGVWIRNRGRVPVYDTLMGILQSTRRRISRAEYISCPGCGRTLFDLQEAVREVKTRTAGLKNIKIAVMGCIVNGPGEMADADYGYVGAGRGTITLYRKKEVVEKNIPQETAVDRLIELIRENGDWNV